MGKMRPRGFQRGKGDYLKKRLIFFAVLAALLCFAVPAVASPPGAVLSIEAMSFDMSNTAGVYTQEAAIVAVPAVEPIESGQANYNGYAYLVPLLIVPLLVIAISGRGIANGRKERRRWV
jgi:hypothetical protein